MVSLFLSFRQFLELCNENMGTADEKNSSSMSLDPQPLVDQKGMDAKERNKHWKKVGFRWVSFFQSFQLASENCKCGENIISKFNISD